jgi:hypothetical protein
MHHPVVDLAINEMSWSGVRQSTVSPKSFTQTHDAPNDQVSDVGILSLLKSSSS